MTSINLILIGAITLACITTSLFFLRSWKITRDRFFLFFSLSFFLQGISALTKGLIDQPLNDEGNPSIYQMRLLAFILILIAVTDKNWTRNKKG